jgi:hypothetical protein
MDFLSDLKKWKQFIGREGLAVTMAKNVIIGMISCALRHFMP